MMLKPCRIAAYLGCLCGFWVMMAGEVSADEIFVTARNPEAEAPERHLLIGDAQFGEWQFVSGKKGTKLGETWRIVSDPEPVLICTGEPYGYLKTARTFRNFEMGLQWKFPSDPTGNSGILLFTSGHDRIWPSALQVQLLQSELGFTFPSGAQKVHRELRHNAAPTRPLNQWNEGVIRCFEGQVTVTINGHLVGEVTGCNPREGGIALQSEGSEIHFRRVWIREIQATERADSTPRIRSHIRRRG